VGFGGFCAGVWVQVANVIETEWKGAAWKKKHFCDGKQVTAARKAP
jgi:hypothetical protein